MGLGLELRSGLDGVRMDMGIGYLLPTLRSEESHCVTAVGLG